MLRLALLALSAWLGLHAALASAQDAPSLDDASVAARAASSEPAMGYDASTERRPSRGRARPELQGWRRAAESGLRLRLEIESSAVAAENARRDREGGDIGSHGVTAIVLGIVCLAGGVVTEFVAIGVGIGDAVHSRGTSAGLVAIGGGVSAGVGVLGLITGGILLSQRPRHLQPGEVALALGAGSLALSGSF